jgi:hypothetical protein
MTRLSEKWDMSPSNSDIEEARRIAEAVKKHH